MDVTSASPAREHLSGLRSVSAFANLAKWAKQTASGRKGATLGASRTRRTSALVLGGGTDGQINGIGKLLRCVGNPIFSRLRIDVQGE